jgi:ADP-ribose pyrophosphatase YjhB (NUDIX family)
MKALLARLYRLLPQAMVKFLVRLAHPQFTVRVAGVFRTADGRILLLRHVFRHSYPWGLPAGFLEAGESPEAGVLRELREETGLVAEIEGIARIRPVDSRHLEITLAGRIDPAQTIIPSLEIFEAGYFKLDTLPGPMPPEQQALIRGFTGA